MMKIAAFLLLFPLFSLSLWGCKQVQTVASEKPSVLVVRSISELRNQPPVILPDGVTVRLGIGGSESYIGGRQLLYCLATGLKGPVSETGRHLRLGPVAYEVTNPWEVRKIRELGEAIMCAGWGGKREVLFCVIVQTPSPGDYRIRFLSLDDKPLGFATITAKKPDPHPWQPVGCRWEQEQCILVNDSNPGAALPSIHGLGGTPDPVILPRLPLSNDVAQTGDFNIALKGTTLTLTFDTPVSCRPDINLLCRWWVNDKPIAPPILSEPPSRCIEDRGRQTDKMVVKIEVDGERLGAKPGDTVGLQLLLVPDWEYVCPPGHGQLHALMEAVDLRVSNRINFTYKRK